MEKYTRQNSRFKNFILCFITVFAWQINLDLIEPKNESALAIIIAFFQSFKGLVLSISTLYSNALLPVCNVTPGSTREMLSIPFQQTARSLKYLSDKATDKERKAISAVLDYDRLIELYNPERADNVKDTYNENATKEELIIYFEVWLEMLKKHPSHYIHVTMNNCYYYFYPGNRLAQYYTFQYSKERMEVTNRRCEELQTDFGHPAELDSYRNNYEKIRESIWSMSILSILLTPAIYSWTLILILFMELIKKSIRNMYDSTIMYSTFGVYCRIM